ncbi:ABC transporter ATP-binding protein [Cellulomonas hominis]|uniref:ABC transporter ATP-binding protein n=1 Tax=Cellulomonas hominis TaxID=156981 RepID=UPI001B9A29DE|nr:ABC transporter ATP-binding protein [Cellulomonas hominis]VTR75864.1 Lipoprotein-releasing system ATP-binding protein LolD [Cellulomonas hominis]
MSPGAREVAVVGTGLGHRFRGTDWLFRGLELALRPGELTGVVGPSGCGKSTLLGILAGWERPTEGVLTLRGVARTGWVFQNPHGVARRTALDHVVLPLLARGATRRAAGHRAREVMDAFRLADLADRPFAALSGGEAQRLMLARAVCAAPDLLLVDEPTAQLDVRTAATVNETLAGVAASGAVVVIATHDPGTRDACDHVIDMRAQSDSEESGR